MKIKITSYVFILGLLSLGAVSYSQNTSYSESLPLKKVALFSSGVGYFEHRGSIEGKKTVQLYFQRELMKDVLKSLLIFDTGAPVITYDSEDSLEKILQSKKINLSYNPSILRMFSTLQGQEIHITLNSSKITGRIVSTETTKSSVPEGIDSLGKEYVTLLVNGSIQRVAIDQIESFSFTDPSMQSELESVLHTLAASKNSQTRQLSIALDATDAREVTLAYVVPTAVWKSSWRLDVKNETSLLQGWAIVDNTSSTDWENVQLSFITGKPVSFIQNLYEPYFVQRMEIPLLGVGSAKPTLYESGYAEQELLYDYAAEAPSPMASSRMTAKSASNYLPEPKTQAKATGEYFEYTLQTLITVPQQKSVMVPLVNAKIGTKKVSIFSNLDTATSSSHPMLAIELKNTSGMKLPAGAITVFDSGLYAGDALIQFFPENETRFIAYAEDISVIGMLSESKTKKVAEVILSKGVLRMKHHIEYTKNYTFKNSSNEEKNIILEHQLTQGALLINPTIYDEKTASLYRFSLPIKKSSEKQFSVTERVVTQENISLSKLKYETLLVYASSGDIPGKILKAFEKIQELKNKMDSASQTVSQLEEGRVSIFEEQERIRDNIQILGRDSIEGKEYIVLLFESEKKRESIDLALTSARKKEEEAKNEYIQYISTVTIE